MQRVREEKEMMTTKIAAAAVVLMLAGQADPLPPPIPAERFDRLHKMLLPSTDELAGFWDLPWEITIQEARLKAAAQDKPILAYFGANGSVLGAT
jgi:hypothetical protein